MMGCVLFLAGTVLNFLPSDFMSPGTAVVQRMKQHYQTVSKEFGFKVSPPEMQINGLGLLCAFSKTI